MFAILWKLCKVLLVMSIGFYLGFIFRERCAGKLADDLSTAFSRTETAVAAGAGFAWDAVSGLWNKSPEPEQTQAP